MNIEQNHQDSTPAEHPERLTFEMIACSTLTVLMRIHRSQLVGSQLAGSFFKYSAATLSDGVPKSSGLCAGLLADFAAIDVEAAQLFLLERQRHQLLSAIAIFDSFLSDVLRFLFLHRPDLIPEKTAAKAELTAENIDKLVRYGALSSWKKRIEKLETWFPFNHPPERRAELSRLIGVRNEIVHHGSGLYSFMIDGESGRVFAEAKTIPEVSFEDALNAQFIVAEVCDAILLSVCRSLFGDEPRVRLLPPEVVVVQEQLRMEWNEKRNQPPEIEEIAEAGWEARESEAHRDGVLRVFDLRSDFIFSSVKVGEFELMVAFTEKTTHGSKISIEIDDGPREELKTFYSREFIDQLKASRTLLVEFFEEHQQEPRYTRYSLAGFASAWERLLEHLG